MPLPLDANSEFDSSREALEAEAQAADLVVAMAVEVLARAGGVADLLGKALALAYAPASPSHALAVVAGLVPSHGAPISQLGAPQNARLMQHLAAMVGERASADTTEAVVQSWDTLLRARAIASAAGMDRLSADSPEAVSMRDAVRATLGAQAELVLELHTNADEEALEPLVIEMLRASRRAYALARTFEQRA